MSAAQPPIARSNTPLGATIITLLVVVMSSFGLVFLQNPLQETQDTRSDASSDSGTVIIGTKPSPENQLTINQPASIDITLNPSGKNITDVTLLFNIITNVTDEVELTTYSNYSMQAQIQEVERTDDGFLVAFKGNISEGLSYTGTTAETIVNLSFTPKRAGTFKISFDQEVSKIKELNGSDDILKTVATNEYTVKSNTTTKACNESCTSNTECGTNHRCYENRCRLVTNVSSPTCAQPTTLKQCNETCATNSDCANGNVCYDNRCRREDNPSSTSCAAPSESVAEAIRKSCNQPCTDNRGCANNLRCYQGSCRLATNPSSLTCSATSDKKVSTPYYGEKGGSITPTPTPTPRTRTSPSPSPSSTATISGMLSPRPTPSSLPLPTPSALPDVDPEFQRGLPGISSQLISTILLAVGGILLALAVLFILSRLLRGGGSSSSTTVAKKNTAYEADLQKKIDQLKQQPPTPPVTGMPPKLPIAAAAPASTLSTTMTPPPEPKPAPVVPSAPPAPAPTPSPAPIAPPPSSLKPAITAGTPPASLPTPPIQPSLPTQPPTTSLPTRPTLRPTPYAPARSSMMERLKERGLTTPGNGNGNGNGSGNGNTNGNATNAA